MYLSRGNFHQNSGAYAQKVQRVNLAKFMLARGLRERVTQKFLKRWNGFSVGFLTSVCATSCLVFSFLWDWIFGCVVQWLFNGFVLFNVFKAFLSFV